MRHAWIFLAVVVLAACASSKSQTLLVTDYGYSLDGVTAMDLSSFENRLRPKDPIAVEACSCANARYVIAAVDWLHRHGVETIAMNVVDGAEARCGVCR